MRRSIPYTEKGKFWKIKCIPETWHAEHNIDCKWNNKVMYLIFPTTFNEHTVEEPTEEEVTVAVLAS